MRTAFYGDVSAAARVLLRLPAAERLNCVRELMRQADGADRYVRRKKKLHPEWGNGTLRDVAMRNAPAAEPSFDDTDYCACFAMVLSQLQRRPRCAHL